jgi:hypothetical protein
VQLVEFEKLGFDEEDQEWFTGEFFHRPLTIAGAPNELKALCFLATRMHWHKIYSFWGVA